MSSSTLARILLCIRIFEGATDTTQPVPMFMRSTSLYAMEQRPLNA